MGLERVRVALIVEKIIEIWLRWFCLAERRLVDSIVRRVDQMEDNQINFIRGRGRPRNIL
jgi:hypothetical protein